MASIRPLLTHGSMLAALAAAAVDLHAAPPTLTPVPADVAEAVVRQMRSRARPEPLTERLRAEVQESERLLARIELDAREGRALRAELRMFLEGQVQRFAALNAASGDHLGRLGAKSTDPGHRKHWSGVAGKVQVRFQELAGLLQGVLKAKTAPEAARAAAAARQWLARFGGHEDEAGPSKPQHRRAEPRQSIEEKPATAPPAFVAAAHPPLLVAANGNFGPVLQPIPAEAAQCGYRQADLDATPDVQLTPEIHDLAKSLDYDPRRIYQYVYEEIRFEPYWGAAKGAVGTLWTKAGGPTDQASLTIALLRASNIPARYVRGVVQFRDDRGRRWFGAKTDAAAAWMAFYGWYPMQDFGAAGLLLSHVWVEACVPYGNYRGSRADQSGHRWIPLDPSFKELVYQNGVAVNVAFDYAGYMAARTNELPHERYAKQIETAAKNAAGTNTTLDDVPYKGTLVKRRWDVLPTSLPYRVLQYAQWGEGNTTAEAAALPDQHRQRLAVSVRQGSVGLTSLYSAALSDIAFKRLTVGFRGADAGHEANLQSWRATGSATSPTCTINVVPVIRLAGVDQLAGTIPVGLCSTDIDVALTMRLPEIGTNINDAPFRINAADHAAVIAYALQGSERVFAERYKALGAAIQANAGTLSTLEQIDAVEGEFLFTAGMRYAWLISERARDTAALTHFSNEPGPHLGLTSSKSKVSYLFDQPLSVSLKGALVDVSGAPLRLVRLDETSGNPATILANTAEMFRFTLYHGSAHEHNLWQETARLDAVSTVRGLQYAAEKGTAVLQFNWVDAATFSSQWDAQMNPDMAQFKAGIQSQLQTGGAGSFVRIHQKRLAYVPDGGGPPWNGAAWELNTPNSITMAISGNFNGGYASFDPIDVGFIYEPPPPVFVPSTVSFNITVTDQPTATPTFSDGIVSGATTLQADPVNMATGNLYHVERDLAIKGRGGLPIVFERSYNSRQAKDGPLGFGWTHSFNHFLRFYGVDGGTAKLSWTDGTGAEKFFKTASHASGNISLGATLEGQPGIYATVTRNADGTFRVREKNGLAYTFESVTGPSSPPALGSEPRARLLSIADRNGNTLTLAYTAACGNNLCAVTDGLNRALTFTYTGSRITQIQDFSGRQFQYVYDPSGNLTGFKNPLAVAGTQNPVTYAYYSDPQLNHALRKYTLPRGNGMSFEYYMNGKVLRHTTTLGETTSFFYNDFRRESSAVNERGFRRSFFFDTNGNLATLIEENGATRTYGYADPAHPYSRTSKTDPSGYLTSYQYDAAGNVTLITNPSGATVAVSNYNGFGQPGKVKNANGNYTLAKYDAKGNVTDTIVLRQGVGAAVDPASYVPNPSEIVAWTKTSYNGFGNVTQTKPVKDFAAQAGPAFTNNYDASGLNVLSIQRCGDKGQGISECDTSPTMGYDPLGRQTAGLTAGWYPTETQYDSADRVTRASDAMGNLRELGYDANGNLLSQTLTQVVNGMGQLRDSSGAAYDLSDRRTRALDAAGNATLYEYDAAGNVVKITNADGFFVGFEYDENNRAVRAYDETGHAVSTVLDFEGRKRSVTDPAGAKVSYDYYGAVKDGRLQKVTDAASRVTTYDYDANGNVTSVTDNLGRATRTNYDELNRPFRVVGPAYTDRSPGSPTFNTQICPVTRNFYDKLGRLTQVSAGYTAAAAGVCGSAAQDLVWVQMTYAYDDFGRKLKDIDGLNRAWVYRYDVNNNVIQATDPRSQTTTLTYGYGGRLATRSDQAGRRSSYVYNPRGQVVTAQSPEVTYSYTYDAALRLDSVNDSRGNKTIAYQYSAGGRLTRMTIDDMGPIDYRYDATGKLATIWDPFDTVVFYQYETLRLKQRLLANGNSTEFNWNLDGTLAKLTNSFMNGQGLQSTVTQHDYLYDALGRRSRGTDEVGFFRQPATAEAFAYDPLHNRTQRTAAGIDERFGFDGANQLTEVRDGIAGNALVGALVYDANGNLNKKCTGSVSSTGTDCIGSSVLSLTFDASNRLSRASGPNGTETYGYDDQGRRIRKTVNGVSTFYLYNGADIVAEYGQGWGKPTAITLHGAGTDDPIARYTRNGSGTYDKAYYQADGLGSVVALTKDDGTITGAQMFDSWGAKIATSSIGAVPAYGYTGREPDATGLIYYRARYYDPSIGRFVSQDPIGMRGGPNYYSYVRNDPINRVDPAGLHDFFHHLAFGYEGNRRAGGGIISSAVFGWLTAWVDLRSGSQGTDVASASGHYMAGKLGDTFVSREVARAESVALFRDALAGADGAAAAHLVADMTARAHDNQPWGGKLDRDHVKADFTPTLQQKEDAINNTATLLRFMNGDQSVLVEGNLNFADSKGGAISIPMGDEASGFTYIPPVTQTGASPLSGSANLSEPGFAAPYTAGGSTMKQPK